MNFTDLWLLWYMYLALKRNEPTHALYIVLSLTFFQLNNKVAIKQHLLQFLERFTCAACKCMTVRTYVHVFTCGARAFVLDGKCGYSNTCMMKSMLTSQQTTYPEVYHAAPILV